jgi:hypothetical protein
VSNAERVSPYVFCVRRKGRRWRLWHELRCSMWGEGTVGSAVIQGSSCFDLLPVSSIAERPSLYAFCVGR